MSLTTQTRLTPRQRLTRGLTYTALGPVDVTRGVVGLGLHSAQAGAANLRRRYREGRLARDLAGAQQTIAQELAAAGEVVSGLPAALQQARQSRRRTKRPWVIAGVAAAAVLAGGAVAFSIVRRSSHKDSSPRPPSVDVQPKL
jgi:hypothetical protein